MRVDLDDLPISRVVEGQPLAINCGVRSGLAAADAFDLTPTVLGEVEAAVGRDAFRLWFSSPVSVSRNDQAVEVEVANDFLADCIRSFCIIELRASIYKVLGDGLAVRVRTAIAPGGGPAASHRGGPTANSRVQPARKPDHPSPPPAPHLPAMRRQVPTADGPQIETAQAPVRTPAVDRRPAKEVAAPAASLTTGLKLEGAADRDEATADAKSSRREAAGPRNAGESESRSSSGAPKNVPHFVDGDSNRFALTAVNMVVERPGEFGPLFVCGPTGSGKTHLSKLIAERLRGMHRLRRVIRMTGEQFTIDFMDSSRGGGFAAFRRKYRDVDALIIDDVHFLLGKTATIGELRHTVDDLTGRRRQVVLTSNRSLAELTGLGAELHARLSGGVTAAIEPLDIGVRRDLLTRLTAEHGVALDAATIETLATRTSGDGRAVYGLVFRLLAQQRSSGGSITRDQAISCTLDLLRAAAPAVRMADVERVVCQQFGVAPQQLQGTSRSRAVCGARMLAMFLARKHTGAAYSEIGRYFGKRQHSTVIAAQRRVEQWLASDEELSLGRGAARVQALLHAAEASLQAG